MVLYKTYLQIKDCKIYVDKSKKEVLEYCEEIRQNAMDFESRDDLTPEKLNIIIVNWIGFRIDEEVQKKYMPKYDLFKTERIEVPAVNASQITWKDGKLGLNTLAFPLSTTGEVIEI